MHMPDEIRFSSFESSKGLGDISEVEGRQIITYLTPVCPDSQTWYDCKKNADLVTFSLEYSWSFIFVELIPYIILLISLLAMFSVRVRRRRKEKRLLKIQKQELLQSELTEVAAVEVFGSMDSPVVVANESYFEKDDNENDNTS